MTDHHLCSADHDGADREPQPGHGRPERHVHCHGGQRRQPGERPAPCSSQTAPPTWAQYIGQRQWVATLTTSALTMRQYTITADYSGTSTLQESSDSVDQVVNRVATATVLTSSLNPSNVGDPVTFTATVTCGGSPVASGTVQFSDGGSNLGAHRPVGRHGDVHHLGAGRRNACDQGEFRSHRHSRGQFG